MFSLRVFLKWNRSVFTIKNDFNNTNKTKRFIDFQVNFLTVELEKQTQKKICRDPGLFRTRGSSPDLNHGPSDLQSDALPTELSISSVMETLKITSNTV